MGHFARVRHRRGRDRRGGLSRVPADEVRGRGDNAGAGGGYLDEGEQPLEAARRELLEETGYEAEEWRPLGRYAVDANRGCGVGHLFLAIGARKVAEPAADDLEEQELLTLTREQVETALAAGEFEVMSWAATMALALLALDRAS